MLQLPVYLDNQATTRVDPRVLDAMLPFFSEHYGNAASRQHALGRKAEDAVDHARQAVADLVGASPTEIIFTSGATESNNLALKGALSAYKHAGNHLITAATEHPAILDPCKRLEQQGVRVTVLPVDHDGLVPIDAVGHAITGQAILVSIMAANNEIGTLHPIRDIGGLCKERGVLFHTDAAQAVGKIPIDVQEMGIDLLSISAHKIYGPKGIGALYVRKRQPRVQLQPMLDGGGHERGLRSGTLAVPLIVGFCTACALCRQEMAAESHRLTRLRDRLWQGIQSRIPETYLNGHPSKRLPGNLNVSFAHVDADALMMALKDIAVSSGSACTSASVEPSHVLRAIGVPDELARGSLRFSPGRFTTEEEVDYTIAQLKSAVERLRNLNPLYAMEKSRQNTPNASASTHAPS